MIEANAPLERWLNKLIENGSLPESSIPKSAIKGVNNLIDLEYIQKRPVKNGIKFVLIDEDSLINWMARIIKNVDSNQTHNRAYAASKFRTAKKSTKTYPKVEIRFLKNNTNIPSDFKEIQNRIGSVNYYLTKEESWLTGKLVLIENIESFLVSDESFPNCDIAVYYSGNISDSLINHLNDSECTIVFFPDYDPVGMNNYCKIKDKLGDKVELFVPQNICELFESSSYRIIEKTKNREILANLNRRTLPKEVIPIIQLIQKHHGGAEQELVEKLE